MINDINIMDIQSPPDTLPVLRNGGENHLNPTKRGWLLMGRHGGFCDKACKFCYYTFQQDLVFFSLDTLIARANLFRYHYGLEYVDISGGEATVYGKKADGRRPDLETLVHHCASIGLKPTIITHGQNNTPELVKGIEDAGLEDWLISIHGTATGHDKAVVNHSGKGGGGWDKLVRNLGNCQRPTRYNTTIQNYSYHELPELARWLGANRPATVWNMIRFNPFFAWNERPEIDFQAKQSDIMPYVAEAVGIAEAAGFEVNLRYFEPCIAAQYGVERNCVGFFQTQIDKWEWSLAATNRAQVQQAHPFGSWHGYNMAYCNAISQNRKNVACATCKYFGTVCEGFPEQYQERYGFSEAIPAIGEQVNDPAYFSKGGKF